jgi:hypothetical protein
LEGGRKMNTQYRIKYAERVDTKSGIHRARKISMKIGSKNLAENLV